MNEELNTNNLVRTVEKQGKDERGKWLPGFCPNPKGRGKGTKDRYGLAVTLMAYNRIFKKLRDPKVSAREKDAIALEIIKRVIPKSVDVLSDGAKIEPKIVLIAPMERQDRMQEIADHIKSLSV